MIEVLLASYWCMIALDCKEVIRVKLRREALVIACRRDQWR